MSALTLSYPIRTFYNGLRLREKGEKGDRGERGKRGRTGKRGKQGEPGRSIEGPRGEKGPPGVVDHDFSQYMVKVLTVEDDGDNDCTILEISWAQLMATNPARVLDNVSMFFKGGQMIFCLSIASCPTESVSVVINPINGPLIEFGAGYRQNEFSLEVDKKFVTAGMLVYMTVRWA
jgi:hypothetical protein